MTKTKRTVKEEITVAPKMIEIPLGLLRQLVRQTGNRQGTMYLRKAVGGTYKTNPVGENIVESVKVEAKKEITKPTPEYKLMARAKAAEDEKEKKKAKADKVFVTSNKG